MRTCLLFLPVILLVFVTGVVHAAEPATQPTKLASERVEKLNADLKTFTLRLNYHGDEDKPYYRLLLSVQPVAKAEANPFFRNARITEEVAGKIIDELARDGCLDVALDGNRNRSPVPPREPYYSLTVRVENGRNPIQFEEWLTLDKPLLYQRLDGLRAVLEGDAAKGMDLLVGRLSGHRKEVEKAAATQPADGGKITEDRAKDLAKRHLADKGLDWGEPVKVEAVVTGFKLYYATPQSPLGPKAVLVTGTGEVRILPRR